MSTPRILDKLAALTDISMQCKEVLRDIVLNICAFCHYGQRPGYPVYTAIDEDAYGPTEEIPLNVGNIRYLSTTLNNIYLDQVRVSIPYMGNLDLTFNIQINQVNLFASPKVMLGNNSSYGTMKFALSDFAAYWQTNPIPDGARIDVVTSYLSVSGLYALHKGLRVRMEGRWL